MSRYGVPESLPALSTALKAAGEPTRLRILKVLEEGELCVCHLVELIGTSQPTVSRHLGILRAAGLVGERKEGRWTHYRLEAGAPFLAALLRMLAGVVSDDPVVFEDRERARVCRAESREELCSRGKC